MSPPKTSYLIAPRPLGPRQHNKAIRHRQRQRQRQRHRHTTYDTSATKHCLLSSVYRLLFIYRQISPANSVLSSPFIHLCPPLCVAERKSKRNLTATVTRASSQSRAPLIDKRSPDIYQTPAKNNPIGFPHSAVLWTLSGLKHTRVPSSVVR